MNAPDRHRDLAYEPALDGVRAIAIAGVVVFHSLTVSGIDGLRGGFIGVSLFFTLSGYLITSLLLGEQRRTGTIDLGRFWSRRIRRLAPAALVVVAICVLLSGVWHVLSVHTSDAVAAIWSFTNWHVLASGQRLLLQTIVGPLGPTWSLAVEEQFYLVLVLVVAVAARSSQPRRVLAVICAIGWLLPIVLANVWSDWQPRLEFGTDLRAPELFAGVALALWMTSARPPRLGARWGDLIAAGALATVVVLFAIVDYGHPWLLRGGYALVAVISAALIAGLLQHGVVARALSWPPIVALGKLSYSLYLVHWPVISVMNTTRMHRRGAALVVMQIAVALVAAVVLHLAIERPMRRRTDPWRPTVAAWLAGSAAVTVLAVATLG